MSDIWQQLKNEKLITRHYYGDIVRTLFLVGAVIMLVTLPFLNSNLPVPLITSILLILAISAIAGFTNPVQKSTALLNTGASAIAAAVFEYYAVKSYLYFSFTNLMFATNQLLALIFLFALYYSTKTLRAMTLSEKK